MKTILFALSLLICSMAFCQNSDETKPLNDVKQSFNVFPNPATDNIYITSEITGNINYSLIDLSGNIISEGTLTAGARFQTSASNAINITSLTPGQYIIIINHNPYEDCWKYYKYLFIKAK